MVKTVLTMFKTEILLHKLINWPWSKLFWPCRWFRHFFASYLLKYPSYPEYLCGCAQHTHTLCGCAHSVRGGCGRLLHRECAVSVRAGKYQVCSVWKFVLIKKLKKLLYLKPKVSMCFMMLHSKFTTNLGVKWHHICIPYKAFYFWDPAEVCGCGCGKIIKKCTCAVRECAGWKAIVRRVCGCAKIGYTQILWSYL